MRGEGENGRRRPHQSTMRVIFVGTILTLLLWCFSIRPCDAADRIVTGDTLRSNETLISDGGTFALGFFTLGASPLRHYLGIWYNNFPGNKTVVWVANNEMPFTDFPVVLRISNDSNLVVTNAAGAVLWSTNVAADPTAAGESMTAVLLGSGNLELRATKNDVVRWRSFDHVGNTALPGMTIWFNATTGRGNQFRSWKSADDPATGDFTMGVDPATVLQIIIWKNNRTFWRYNPWDGFLFGGAGLLNNVYASYFSIQGSPDAAVSITFTSSLSIPQRLYLDHNGVFYILVWPTNSSEWTTLWSNSKINACEGYAACGPYGFCNETGDGTPACSCLPGFSPRDLPEWSKGNHSAGCARPAPWAERSGLCDQKDVFNTIGTLKLPDKMVFLKQVTSAGDCEDACRRNCSCTAYAHANATNINVTTTRCLVWHDDLIDLVQYRASNPGESLHFRLLGSATHADKRRKTTVIITAVVGVTIVTAIIISCLAWRYKKTLTGFWRRRESREQTLQDASSSSLMFSDIRGKDAGADLPMWSFEYISSITSNFSHSNKLGEGGFGKVYKGVIPTGMEVAIKRLSRGSSQGQEEFRNEVALIAKLQHRNLVRLVGSCIQGEERILIYEYVPNGSLNNFLFDPAKQVQLDWETRFNIIKGIARGLMYLHQDSRFKIVHRDLKPGNVLLDENMNPKISDFGMARMFGGNESRCLTQRVVGTYGYMSPEYAMEGHYSVKSDVYSFGVLLLEIISGRRNNIIYHENVCMNLLTYAWHMWKEENVMGFSDRSIASTSSPAEVSRCLHVGLMCVQDHASKRPLMTSVVFMLENDAALEDNPKRPMFMLEATQENGEGTRSGSSACASVNDVSITAVEGR